MKYLDYFINNSNKLGYNVSALFFQLSTIAFACSLEPAKVFTSKIILLFSIILQTTV